MPPIAIVVSRYNRSVTDALLDAAIGAYEARGGERTNLAVIDAPGTFELAAIAGEAAACGVYAGVCCLGCVIRGETTHDEHIARAVAHALADTGARTGVPCAYGVVTANDAEQAKARAGGDKGNKGSDAMGAVLDAAGAIAAIREAAEGEAPGFVFSIAGERTDKAGRSGSGEMS